MTLFPRRDRVVDQPEPGYFVLRLVKGGPRVAGRITRDDNGLWAAEINGEPCGESHADPTRAAGVLRLWHGAEFSTESEYAYLTELRAWALAHDPNHPAANPEKVIDLRLFDPLF